MTVPASLSKWAHPPRSNAPRSATPATGTPGPCITPSTETCVVVVSSMVALPLASPCRDGCSLLVTRKGDPHTPPIGPVRRRSVRLAPGLSDTDRALMADRVHPRFLSVLERSFSVVELVHDEDADPQD